MGAASRRLSIDAASRAPHPPPLRGSGDGHGGAEDGEFAVFDLVDGHVFHGGLHAALGAKAGFECTAGAAEFDSRQYATGQQDAAETAGLQDQVAYHVAERVPEHPNGVDGVRIAAVFRRGRDGFGRVGRCGCVMDCAQGLVDA